MTKEITDIKSRERAAFFSLNLASTTSGNSTTPDEELMLPVFELNDGSLIIAFSVGLWFEVGLAGLRSGSAILDCSPRLIL